jgi:hypothetical protein
MHVVGEKELSYKDMVLRWHTRNNVTLFIFVSSHFALTQSWKCATMADHNEGAAI